MDYFAGLDILDGPSTCMFAFLTARSSMVVR